MMAAHDSTPQGRAATPLALVNQRTDEAIADRVEIAVTRSARRKGLLGRSQLDASSALILSPCAAIHTMFMRFAIDAVFVDEDGRAVKVVHELEPWRIAIDPFAHAVIELPSRSLRERELQLGDRLYLLAGDGQRISLASADLRGHAC